MTENEIINNLKDKTYCKLGCSKIHGVGVFAIKKIPKGTRLFDEYEKLIWFEIDDNKLKEIDENVLEYLKKFYVKRNNKYFITNKTLNEMGLMFYINHSENPNIEFFTYCTMRDIDVDEELTLDYREIFNENKII